MGRRWPTIESTRDRALAIKINRRREFIAGSVYRESNPGRQSERLLLWVQLQRRALRRILTSLYDLQDRGLITRKLSEHIKIPINRWKQIKIVKLRLRSVSIKLQPQSQSGGCLRSGTGFGVADRR